MISAFAIDGLPEITQGLDLALAVVSALEDGRQLAGEEGSAPTQIRPDDVLVIAHKAVSKAEGRLRSFGTSSPATWPKAWQPSMARTHASSR